MDNKQYQFASDNYSGISPEVLRYIELANKGHDFPYGEDSWTSKTADRFREIFELDCDVYFVFNGTAANSLAISSLCKSYNSIICANTAHIETDECGAPEFFSNGSKLLHGQSDSGKLSPQFIEETVNKRTDIHFPKPKVVSVTQATELGTVYSLDELAAIREKAQKYSLNVHMDGARFANALAHLKVSPKEIIEAAKVDVLCLGGTKNGMPNGDAVIFFKKEFAEDFGHRCKQAGQLASKMRFISAPWLGLLENDNWLKYAGQANNCAKLLEKKLMKFSEIKIMFPCQANSIFVQMPEKLLAYLENKGWHFYTFIGVGGARLMCSWDTTEEHIDELVDDIKVGLLSFIE
jgi:threonine aldolase